MPDPIIISPSGFIAQYNYPTYPFRGVGQAPLSVVPQLPGGSTLARGVGEFDLTNVSAAAGTMEVQLVTPGVGTVAVAFLVDNATTPTAYCGIALDNHARVYTTITSVTGTVVAQTTNSAAFGTAGVPLNVVLAWNANATVRGSFFAYLKINGVFVPNGDWSTVPNASWLPFTPTALLLGIGNLGGLSDFTPASSLVSVQLGSFIAPVPTDTLALGLVGSSTVVAALTKVP